MMLSDATLLAARVLMAILFLAGAIPKLRLDPGEVKAIEGVGIPAARPMAILCGLCQLAGAAMLLLGIWTRPAAALMAAFVIIVTPLFIRFWTAEDPAQRAQMIQAFFGNFGVTAGLLAFSAVGPGSLALMPTT